MKSKRKFLQLDFWPELRNVGMVQLARLSHQQTLPPARPQLCEDAQRAASAPPWYIGDNGVTLPERQLKMSESACLSRLPLPDGFGLEVDLQTGEVRQQIAPGQYELDQFENVAMRYMTRDAARRLLRHFRRKKNGSEYPIYRVVRCGYSLLSNTNGVQIFRAVGSKRSHFAGLVQCGSVWHCPVCAAKIAVRRRAELLIATNRTVEEGGVCGLLTCTIKHAADENCALVLQRLQVLFDRLNAGKSAKKFREEFEIFGQVRALEFTKGVNGWHPHIHSLLFSERPIEWSFASEALYVRYASAARKEFGFDLPRAALDLRGGSAAAEYIAKWGIEYEIAGTALKRARDESDTPFSLLSKYIEGDKSAGQQFVEFATSVSRPGENRVHSTRQLVWSRGLKKRFAIVDLSDEEIAAREEESAVLLGTLSFEQWLKVLGQPFDARVVLLQISSVGTFDDVLSFVQNLPPPVSKPKFY